MKSDIYRVAMFLTGRFEPEQAQPLENSACVLNLMQPARDELL